jgi:hypothetical protein
MMTMMMITLDTLHGVFASLSSDSPLGLHVERVYHQKSLQQGLGKHDRERGVSSRGVGVGISVLESVETWLGGCEGVACDFFDLGD